MTMTRIEIEQYGHTWRAEVEGGPGMVSRRRTPLAVSFTAIVLAVARAYFEINEQDPDAGFREIGNAFLTRYTSVAPPSLTAAEEIAANAEATRLDILRRYPQPAAMPKRPRGRPRKAAIVTEEMTEPSADVF